METFIIVLLLFVVGFMVYLWRMFTAPSNDAKTPEDTGELIHDNAIMTRELKEFSEELFDKIDQRMARLENLIKSADDRISTLESMTENTGSARRQPARAIPVDPALLNNPRGADLRNATQLNRRTAILTLARKGLNTEQIAQEVGMGRGEVDLILNVEKQRKM